MNHAWDHSFARPISNHKAIFDRGWNPLNRCLLLDESLRYSMTDEEKAEEGSRNIILPMSTCTTLATTTCTTMTIHNPTASSTPPQPIVTFDPQYLVQYEPNPPALNFSTGPAAFCLDDIVRNKDLMESRERIKNERKERKSISELVQEQKGAFSAGKAFNAGLCEIGKTVLILLI